MHKFPRWFIIFSRMSQFSGPERPQVRIQSGAPEKVAVREYSDLFLLNPLYLYNCSITIFIYRKLYHFHHDASIHKQIFGKFLLPQIHFLELLSIVSSAVQNHTGRSHPP